MRCRLAALLLACAAPAQAQDETLRLVAISNTAMAITGDIEIGDGLIVFGNGETLLVENVEPGIFLAEGVPSGPLLNGNSLCGDDGEVTVLTLHQLDDGLLVLTAADWQDWPDAEEIGTWEGCATFTYEEE